MASIRRTLSPAYRDRAHQNGETLFSVSSPSQKFLPSSKQSSLFSSLIAASELQRYPPRKGQHGWRRVICRCCFFFLIGLLLGLVPFGHVQDDIHSRDFSFEIKPVHVNVQSTNQSDHHVVNDNLSAVDPVDFPINSATEVNFSSDYVQKKQLIVVTPTYNRALQAYFLNRLSQVLRLVPTPLLWIVVETSSASMETAEMLRKTGVMYRYLVCTKNLTNLKDRGVYQRNTALEHIDHHKLDGIVYFADDDDIYSVELFQSLRDISRFGTWPVAMLEESKNKAILEGPVCNGSQVIGWHTNEKSKRLRRFHVDMSGFAFNSTILWDPKRWRRPTSVPIRQLDTVKEGFQETTFVEQLVEDERQMESTPPGCSRIMNWHLHLEAPNIFYPRGWLLEKNLVTNLHFK